MLWRYIVILSLVHLAHGLQFGSGCVRASVSPSPGSLLGSGPEWHFEIEFSTNVGLKAGPDVVPLASWDTSSLQAFAGSTPLINISSYDLSVSILPISYVTLSNSSIRATFNGNDLLAFDTIVLHIGFVFVELETQQFGYPAQGWMTYGIQSPPSHTFTPPPNLPCPLDVFSPLVTGSFSGNISTAITCTGEVCELKSTIFHRLNAKQQFFSPINVHAPDGHQYVLSRSLYIDLVGSDYSVSATMSEPLAVTPSFEVLLDKLPSDPMLLEISSSEVQHWLSLVTTGPSWVGDQAELRFPAEGNRLFNPSDDSLVVEEIEAGFPTYYLAKLTFANGSTVILGWERIQPRPDKAWFIRWGLEDLGVHCEAESARNSHSPLRPVSHRWANSIDNPWSVFALSASNSIDGSVSVTVDSQPCAAACQHFARYSLPSLNLNNFLLAMPDIRVYNATNQNASNWLIIPTAETALDFGCGGIATNSFNFVHSNSFCASEFGSCLHNQLTNFISQPQYRAYSAFGPFTELTENSTGSWLPRLRLSESGPTTTFHGYLDGASMVVETIITSPMGDIAILQPHLSVGDLTASSSFPRFRLLSLVVHNTGTTGTVVSAHLTCSQGEAPPITVTIANAASEVLLFNLTIPQSSQSLTVSCEATVSTPTKPYWSNDGKTATTPAWISNLLPNGCWVESPGHSLFLSHEQWLLVNSTAILDPEGALGPDPAHIDVAGFWVEVTSREYQSVATFTTNVVGSEGGPAVLSVSVSCANASSPATEHFLSLNVSTPIEHSFRVLGSAIDTNLTCSLVLSLSIPDCAPTLGTTVVLPFKFLIPGSPCYQSPISEPFLFLSGPLWSVRELETFPQPLARLTVASFWTPRPTTPQGWTALGLDEDAADIPFNDLYQVSTVLHNAGNATGEFEALAVCENSIFFSRSLSVGSCILGPEEYCTILMTFLANETQSLPGVTSCTLIAQIVVNPSVCWSASGKTYLQEFVIQKEAPSSPFGSPSPKSDRGLFGIGKPGSTALIVIICFVAVALVVLLVALVVFKSSAKKDLDYAPETSHHPVMPIQPTHDPNPQISPPHQDGSASYVL